MIEKEYVTYLWRYASYMQRWVWDRRIACHSAERCLEFYQIEALREPEFMLAPMVIIERSYKETCHRVHLRDQDRLVYCRDTSPDMLNQLGLWFP